jgi:hypothetical protein
LAAEGKLRMRFVLAGWRSLCEIAEAMFTFFARFGSHYFHSRGRENFPGGEALGRFLLRIHDGMPDFLPEWLKWVLIFGPPVILLAWLILKWQRWVGDGE